MAILHYLAHCPTGLGPAANGTHRYPRVAEDNAHPWGFSLDNLFRGFVSFHDAMRRRLPSGSTQTKKASGIDGSMPRNSNRPVSSYTRASTASYDRLQASAQTVTAESTSAQAVNELANALRAHNTLASKKDKAVDPSGFDPEMFSRLWKRTGLFNSAAKYNRLSRQSLKSGTPGPLTRQGVVDAMDRLPPVDGVALNRLIQELYDRGLLALPIETTIQGEDVFEDFKVLLSNHDSIESYIAQLERESDIQLLDSAENTAITALGVEDKSVPTDVSTPIVVTEKDAEAAPTQSASPPTADDQGAEAAGTQLPPPPQLMHRFRQRRTPTPEATSCYHGPYHRPLAPRDQLH